MIAEQAYRAYKELLKAERRNSSYRQRTFSQRILRATRRKPNPKFGGYFISNNGKEDNTGISFDSPIDVATFKKIVLKEWDKVFFERGQIYNFGGYDVVVDNVTFSVFGSGADPILIGSEDKSGNTYTLGSGIYTTTYATPPKWMYANIYSSEMEALRLGESAFIPVTSAPDPQHRVVSAATINALPDSIVGATLVGKNFNFWTSIPYTVVAYNSGTGSIQISEDLATAYMAAGMPLKLYNQTQFINTNGDWAFIGTTLHIQSAVNPDTLEIRAGVEDYGIKVSYCGGFAIENIKFMHYHQSALIVEYSPSPIIEAVTFQHNRGNGLQMYGNDTTSVSVENCVFDYNGLRDIEHAAIQGGSISFNTFSNTGMQQTTSFANSTANYTPGTAISLMVEPAAQAISVPNNIVYDSNVITNVAYQGIGFWGSGHTFSNTLITDYCLRWNDGGGIHSIYRTFAASATQNVTIENVIVTGGVGNEEGIVGGDGPHASGIYVDNGCNDFTINNVTSYLNSDAGVLVNWDTKETTLTNSLCVGNGNRQVWYRQDTDVVDSPVWQFNVGNVLTGNILACMTAAQRCVTVSTFQSITNYNPFSSGGNSDSNAYVNPYGTSICDYKRQSGGTITTNYTLATWRTLMGDDAASTSRTNYITYSNPTNAAEEVKVETNPTASPVNFNVPAGYSDETGAAYSNPVAIAPYSGLIYLKDTAFP